MANISFVKFVVPFPVFTSASLFAFVPIAPIIVCVPPESVNIPFPASAVVIVEVICLPLDNINSELFVIPLFITVFVAYTFPFTVVVV